MTQTSEYTQLTAEGRREILKGKIGQWEGERYNHEVDIDRFDRLIEAGGLDVDMTNFRQARDVAARSVGMLNISIETAQELLAELDAEVSGAPATPATPGDGQD